MTDLYPFLMTPQFDPRPWGRLDLSPIYPRHFDEKIGESWLTGDNCKVQNGAHAGKSLAELSSRFQRELVGEAPRESDRFPLLLKFLFPQEKLSVQVHPDDDAAREIGQPCGKTECWYVVHADSGAEIGLGLKKGTTRAEFEQSVHENRAEELLNWIKVSAGDMIYVAGGTVHTLGPGSIIVETQQQSDTTFRLYDYGRPRELHLKDGLRVIKENVSSGKVRPRAFSNLDSNGNRTRPLVASEYFTVEQFSLSSEQAFAELPGKSSAQILVAIDGGGALVAEGFDPVEFAKGDAVALPATIRRFRIQPRQELQFLRSYVPGIAVGAPETILRR
ncbi:MAG TPA: type I phosphomannose isomerase catalytic subunit [Terriglobales bacterium]